MSAADQKKAPACIVPSKNTLEDTGALNGAVLPFTCVDFDSG